jgi:hypothetical protein
MKPVSLTKKFSAILLRALKMRKSAQWFPVIEFTISRRGNAPAEKHWALFFLHRKDIKVHERCRIDGIDLFFDIKGAELFEGKMLDYRNGRVVAVGDAESAMSLGS